MNQQVEYAKKRETVKDSRHVGETGKRLRGVGVKIERVRALEAGAYGPRSLVTFVDDFAICLHGLPQEIGTTFLELGS